MSSINGVNYKNRFTNPRISPYWLLKTTQICNKIVTKSLFFLALKSLKPLQILNYCSFCVFIVGNTDFFSPSQCIPTHIKNNGVLLFFSPKHIRLSEVIELMSTCSLFSVFCQNLNDLIKRYPICLLTTSLNLQVYHHRLPHICPLWFLYLHDP